MEQKKLKLLITIKIFIMEKIWFYTTLLQIKEVIQNAEIKIPKRGRGNRATPCIWLSTNTDWDETPRIILFKNTYDLDETEEVQLIARIELAPACKLMNWKHYKRTQSISQKQIHEVESFGYSMGFGIDKWYYVKDNIPITYWIRVQYFNGQKWVNYSRKH